MRTPFVLAIDQGTTSTRSIVFDGDFGVAAMAQETFPQHYPAPGWVEHDPDDLWRTVASTMRAAIAKAGLSAGDIAAIGITNQRETTIVWERETGRPVYNAIVWQERRAASNCLSRMSRS
jgi:glycerol kinase